MKYFAFIFSIFLLVSCGPSNEDKAQHEINEGRRVMYLSQDSKALVHFNNAVELNPQLPDGYLYRAKIFINQGKYKKAIEEITVVLELDPDYGEAFNARGQAYFYLGDRDNSCRDWKKAHELGVPNLYNKINHCP